MLSTLDNALLLLSLLGCVQCLAEREKRADDVPALEIVVNHLAQQLTQMEARLTALGNQHTQLQSRFETSQKQVAFLAHHQSDPFNVAAAGTLVYNMAEVNEGNGFDPVTGVFTAPVTGLYVFFVSCKSQPNLDEDVGVLVDGRRLSGCYSFSRDNPELGAALTTVRLTAGQRAWVHLYRDTGRDVRGSFWNTFAGFLVKADA